MCKLPEFCVGDRVQLRGQEGVGEVVQVNGKRAKVLFATLQVSAAFGQLQHAPPASQASQSATAFSPPVRVLTASPDALLTFKTALDLHGLRAAAALSAVDKWLDQGVLLGHKRLTIIHGKGEGILRQAVRTHLRTHSQVKRIVDEHPCRGGAGVTCVELH
ncbi:MAG: Smr/MutS family protein [Bacteroidota bacterium]